MQQHDHRHCYWWRQQHTIYVPCEIITLSRLYDTLIVLLLLHNNDQHHISHICCYLCQDNKGMRVIKLMFRNNRLSPEKRKQKPSHMKRTLCLVDQRRLSTFSICCSQIGHLMSLVAIVFTIEKPSCTIAPSLKSLCCSHTQSRGVHEGLSQT